MNYCQFRNDVIKRMTNAGGGGGILPAEYQQVEFIKSVSRSGSTDSGTALPYIATGITYFADFEIDVQLAGTYAVKFCGSGGNYCLQRYSSAEPYYSLWNGSGSYYKTNIRIDTRTKFRWQDDKIFVNDVYVTDLAKTSAAGGYFNLFTAEGYSGQKYPGIYIYRFTAWDNAGVPIRDMIPCYRKADNVVGLYDVITNNLYANNNGNYWGWLEAGQNV